MGRVSDARERLMKAVLELVWSGSYGGTTIDLICDKAGVKKGSFYHFFDSKADLAGAALQADWESRRPGLDALFSPTIAPLERLRRFAERAYENQAKLRCDCGCVLGCPLFALGAEVCTHEKAVRAKIREILGHYHRYLETAIRDAQAEGSLPAGNAAEKARMVFAYYEGSLTQARIADDAELLRDLPNGVFAMLGLANQPDTV